MKMSHEPGWLMKACHDARMRVMLDHNPSFFVSMPPSIVSESDASELFEKMNARFKAWTGKTLVGFTNQQIKESP